MLSPVMYPPLRKLRLLIPLAEFIESFPVLKRLSLKTGQNANLNKTSSA